MRCLFCKADSSSSTSIEHIVPESFGNTEHVLPAGVVCDGCNNYIAREVEKPILDAVYFRERRFSAVIPNKRGRVVPLDGFHVQAGTRIKAYANMAGGRISVGAHPDVDEAKFIEALRSRSSGTLIFPIATLPDERSLARFVGKVGLEALASRFIRESGSYEELVDKPELDELRHFVRRGTGPRQWPVAQRQLYPADKVFFDGEEHYQLLHEYEVLFIPVDSSWASYECYISLVLFGEEFVLNLGGPELDGYLAYTPHSSQRNSSTST